MKYSKFEKTHRILDLKYRRFAYITRHLISQWYQVNSAYGQYICKRSLMIDADVEPDSPYLDNSPYANLSLMDINSKDMIRRYFWIAIEDPHYLDLSISHSEIDPNIIPNITIFRSEKNMINWIDGVSLRLDSNRYHMNFSQSFQKVLPHLDGRDLDTIVSYLNSTQSFPRFDLRTLDYGYEVIRVWDYIKKLYLEIGDYDIMENPDYDYRRIVID